MSHPEPACLAGPQIIPSIGLNGRAHAMAHVANPILDILSTYSAHSGNAGALYGGLYAIGCALATAGVELPPCVVAGDPLSALFDGYAAMRQSQPA
ncbi:MAG: hypothetical protein GAK34_01671 [Delftia tsuruhatensis]|nr:MAG: hypothetical protein GAK34_01671 [Delftia tsuruhatensis]